MRILLACDFYAPTIGGLERHVARLAKGLVDRGHTVAVVTSASPSGATHSIEDGIEVRRITGLSHLVPFLLQQRERPFPLPFRDPSFVRNLRDEIDRFGPDVVHTHGWIAIPCAAASEGRAHALVATLHDAGLTCAKRVLFERELAPCSGPAFVKCLKCAPSQYGLAKGTAVTAMLRASRPTLSRIDRFLPVAGFLGDLLLPHIATARQMEVVPNFFDALDVPAESVQRPSFMSTTRPTVLFVGALGRFKGVDLLLDIWRTSPPPADLLMIGTTQPDTPTSFPSGVRIITDVPHPQVMAAMRHATVAVLPSQFPEPSPTVVLEAMSCGVPVVASRIGGIPDLVDDGTTGLLVEASDSLGFATAINRLLDDSALCRDLGARSMSRADMFAVGPVVERIEMNYRRALGVRSTDKEIFV